MTKVLLDVKDVTFGYDQKKILDNITFSVHEKDFVGILGPNGAGKTTLLKIILGLLEPDSGKVEFHCTEKHFHIGYVSQKATFVDPVFPATVFDVVKMGTLHKNSPFSSRKKDILAALAQVGMEKYAYTRLTELSGGQQQRIFIARAIVGKPDMLILDEPTVGVDRQTQEQFYELLKKLNQKLALIMVSHDISVISSYATKVACINTKLSFFGTVRDFQKQEKTVFGEGMHVLKHDHCCH